MTAPRDPRRDVQRLAILLGVASLPAVLAPNVVVRASSLADEVLAATSWFTFAHAGLLLLAVPLAAFSGCALVLTPGLLLTRASRRMDGPSEWLFYGFALSLGLVSLTSAVGQAAFGAALRGRTYGLVLAALGAVAAAVAWWRAPASAPRTSPVTGRGGRGGRETLVLVGLAIIGYYFLSPKLLFESFNGDGAHAFESSRLLLRSPFPFWPAEAGPVAGFPGTTSMLYAFPNAWFMRLFGEVEFAARLPFLLYLPIVGSGVIALSRVGRDVTIIAPAQLCALALSLAAYALAMSFSATYNPYSADVALPATQDTLLMVAWLGVPLSDLRRERWWLLWFVLLTVISLPSGMILVAFWIAARWLVERPRPWQALVTVAALLMVTLLAVALVPTLLSALGAPRPGGEYGAAGLLRYFAFLQFTDVARLRYAAIPAGIFPVLALFAWRAQDTVARTLTVVSAAYFAFFFVQAHVSLHHFVPAMLVPMVVALRITYGHAWGGKVWIALAVLAVILAMPRRLSVHNEGRAVGQAVLERVGGYASSDPAVLRASTLFDRVFPYDWDPAVPDSSYGGSPLVWNHYARHEGGSDEQTNYIVQRATDPVPPGWRVMGSDSANHVLLVRSDSVLAAHRALRPPTPAGSRWLSVPRSILFRSVPHDGNPRIIDVAATLESLGIDVDPWLARLGVPKPDQ